MAIEHWMYLAAPIPAQEVAAIVLGDAQNGGLMAPEATVEALMEGVCGCGAVCCCRYQRRSPLRGSR